MRYTRLLSALAITGATLFATTHADAQYADIANQIPNLIAPALSGTGTYRGFVELSGVAGIGNNRANFVSLSTSQGYQYTPWFFMGAGVGVDMAKGVNEHSHNANRYPDYWYHNSSDTRVMVPVFTDFRVTLGQGTIRAYADLKTGAAWILGNKYLRINDARMSTYAQFFLQPSVGIRLATSAQHPNNAVNVGLTYRLLTSNNNYYWQSNSVTLNGLGMTIGYEW